MTSVAFQIGNFKIYWYSICILLAVIIGGYVAIKEAKKYRIPEEFMINLFFYMIPFAYIGARLYYVAFNWEYYSNHTNEIIQIWKGGLAIHGGLIVGLILAQAIGRWGNFFNQEAHGSEVTLEFLKSLHLPQFIIDGMHIDGAYFHPTFLYESLACLIGFIILLIFRRRRYTKIGQTTSLYLILYGVIRFFMEGLRTDSLMLGNFKMAQIVSILMVIIGIIMYIVLNKGSKLENRYNDGELVEDVNF